MNNSIALGMLLYLYVAKSKRNAMMPTMDHAAAGVALLALLAGSQAERSSFPCTTVDECTRAELWSAAAQLAALPQFIRASSRQPASRQRPAAASWLL